jgi:hypothetical protein
MGTIGERMREIPAASLERSFPLVTSPEFERPFAHWMDQGEGSPFGDLRRLAFIGSAGLKIVPVVSGELIHVHGNIGARGAQKSILCVLSPAKFTSMSRVCASRDEALPQSQG